MFGQACDQQSQLQYAVAIVTTIVQCCPAMFYAVKRRAGLVITMPRHQGTNALVGSQPIQQAPACSDNPSLW